MSILLVPILHACEPCVYVYHCMNDWLYNDTSLACMLIFAWIHHCIHPSFHVYEAVIYFLKENLCLRLLINPPTNPHFSIFYIMCFKCYFKSLARETRHSSDFHFSIVKNSPLLFLSQKTLSYLKVQWKVHDSNVYMFIYVYSCVCVHVYLSVSLSLYTPTPCVCVCVFMCACKGEERERTNKRTIYGNLFFLIFFFLPCALQKSNSSHPTWWQVPLITEASC